jgi:hypothetical protein
MFFILQVIDLAQYGKEIEVIDNGSGIAPSDFASVARKHHTSKLSSFDDLESVSSFGFRGEALAALANVARLSMSTRRACDGIGTRLEFDGSGEVISSTPISHAVGTSVSVKEVFRNLPVRQEEFLKNVKREYGKLLPLIQSYMLICDNVKISLFNTTVKRQQVLSSSGKADMRENAVLAFGFKEAKVVFFCYCERSVLRFFGFLVFFVFWFLVFWFFGFSFFDKLFQGAGSCGGGVPRLGCEDAGSRFQFEFWMWSALKGPTLFLSQQTTCGSASVWKGGDGMFSSCVCKSGEVSNHHSEFHAQVGAY